MNLKAALSFLAITWFNFLVVAQQDQITIKGKVTGEDSPEGLPGVTVQIKGTTNGVISDIDGNYQITCGTEASLVYSFMGYQPIEQPVNSRTVINVTLPLDVKGLDEVVIVGYGEQKKANLTGAITTIEPEELAEIPTGNLAQTLIGKLAGVQVNRNGTGIPGTDTPLVIRDESASGNIQRQVLYVIDGVIYTSEQDGTGPSGSEIFNRLDPTEIESISILKDAAAAVYGARAAGGVVLVRTKRGKAGKPRFNYSGSVGLGVPTQVPEMLTGEQHAKMLNEIALIRGNQPGQRPPRPADLYNETDLDFIRGRNFDWLDGLYRTAQTHRHSLNVSGGSESVRYFVGGNYYYETGNFDNLWYRRFSLRSNVEANISKNIVFNIGMNFSEGQNRRPSFDPGGNVGEGVLREFYKRPLTAPKWLNPVVDGKAVEVGNGSWNPYGLRQSGSYRYNSSNNINILPELSYSVPFVKGLKLRTRFSFNLNTNSSTRYNQNFKIYEQVVLTGSNSDKLVFQDSLNGNFSEFPNNEGLSEGWNRGINYQWNTSINYGNTFGKHNISALLVYEQTDGHNRDFSFFQTNSIVQGYPYVWAFNQDAVTVRGLYHQTGRWGLIGRINYDYDGKYLFESAFRGEASSKFAPSERFGFFPSVSLGWVLSEESFIKDNLAFVDFLKLRASVGILGNDNTTPYDHQVAFIPSDASESPGPIFGTGSGSLTSTVEARKNGFTVPSRTWAKVNNNNIGLDLRSLSNKLNLTLEYYYNRTYDAFDKDRNYPFVVGNDKPPFENYRESFSTGQEIMIGWSDKIGSDFGYSLDANLSKRRSRPLKIYQNPAVVGTWVDELRNDDSNQPGFIALGIIRTDEDLEMVKAMYPNGDGTINGVPIQKGMIYYKDVGGPNYSEEPDGILDGNDRRIIAEYTSPPYSYGFSLAASWKGFKLSASFGGAFGHKEFINKDEQATPTYNSNVFSWWGDYYTEGNPDYDIEPNLDAEFPRPYAFGYQGETSTFWMRDGHTLRLNFLNFSYQMPKALADRLKLQSWKLYASATNVWTIISPFDYKDPSISRGYDYPLVRTINIGTNFSL